MDYLFFIGEVAYGFTGGLNHFVVEDKVTASSNWYLHQQCTPRPVHRVNCRGDALCVNNGSTNDNEDCNFARRLRYATWNENPNGIGNFRWRTVQLWRSVNPSGAPVGDVPSFQPGFQALPPANVNVPSVMKWADPLSWPVTAFDPGVLKIPQAAIRARGNNNPYRVPAESFIRGYTVPQPGYQYLKDNSPSILEGTGEVEVIVRSDGSKKVELRPNTHEKKTPPKGTKEVKKKIDRNLAIILGIVNETTEAFDMFECLFKGIPYKHRKAYAKWRIQTERANMRKLWPSMTDDYIDYLLRSYRNNKGVKRDIWKVDGKHVHLPAWVRDNEKANMGPLLTQYIKKIDDISVGSPKAGFSFNEKMMLIDKHFDDIVWFEPDPSKPEIGLDKPMPTAAAFAFSKGVLPCLAAQQVDDLLAALPGMSLESYYKKLLDRIGIRPDRITGLEFGPAFNP